MKFQDLEIGQSFIFDGEKFVKTTDGTAWSLRGQYRYKLWAFHCQDLVAVVGD